MTRLSLALLGPMQITLDGQPAGGFAYNKARALLAYLAVEAGRPHQRDTLAALLWPNMPDEAARHNLRQALANLRAVLGDASATPPRTLLTRDTIQFNLGSDDSLDFSTFAALLRACERHAHRHMERCRSCAARMEQAVALYQGDFLAGFNAGDSAPFEEWQLRLRERLHQHALAALARLAAYYERRGEDERARGHAQRQIELEPWREEAHRQLMRLFARTRQRSSALAQYETCRRVLARDLGVEPEATTTALYEQIRDGAPSTEHREPGTDQTRHAQVPNASTPLIGRERELAELGTLLENPACRLITIVGPGGIGKTRLALAAATEQAEIFADGAAFVPLQPISSAAFLAPAILSALNMQPQSQRDPQEYILAYLRDKELLLVLDNFEHLLAPELSGSDDATALLTDILRRAPGVTFLVTSRERLALHDEWLFDLPGLNCPVSETVSAIESYSAVQLFMRRASQVRRHFAPVEADLRAVVQICRAVEGLPLAIELAAAALRTHSCTAIAAAIENKLLALAIDLRGVPERHRSIRAAFEHSWRLLSAEEQQVFPRLSVFRGGFDQDAAAEVAGATPQILASLIDKSLLRWDGVKRYDLHELIRQFAGAKLEQAGDMEQTCNTHLLHYLTLAESAESQLAGAELVSEMNRLDVEHDNARAALRWALQRDDSVSALRLSASMGKFWEVRGYLSEGRQWLAQALTLSREVGANQGAASALPSSRALALRQAGTLAWCQCDFAQARELLELSLSLYVEFDNQLACTEVLGTLGGIAFEQGDYATARAHYEECLACMRKEGKPRWIGDALFCVGLVAYNQGDYAAAQTMLEESVKLLRDSGYELGITYPLNALGNLANLQGDYAAAQAFYEECLVLRRKLAYKRGIAATLADMANLQTKLADYATAWKLYKESLALYGELENKRGVISLLSGLACLTLVQGQLLKATRLLSVVEVSMVQLGARLGEPQYSDMQQATAAARAQLDEASFAAAKAEGQHMPLEQAIAYALEISSVQIEHAV